MIRIRIKWPNANNSIKKYEKYLTRNIGEQNIDWRWQWVINPVDFTKIIVIDIIDNSKQVEAFTMQMMWS